MWKELIDGLRPGCEFLPPTDSQTIRRVEKRLSIKFPKDLRSLLREANGIWGPSGTGLIWSVERIEADNKEFRTMRSFRKLYMPFDHLLFFGDDGSGDQYAFRILAGVIRDDEIYRWEHEDDSRNWSASHMRDYLARSLGHSSWYGQVVRPADPGKEERE